eukprot:scaffold380_cov272-Pinguiococcus_pyrenoidosus.AAC.10
MGAAATAQQHHKYENYYLTVVADELEETLLALDFTREDGSVLYHAFRDIDTDKSGEISVEEFHEYLGVTQTRFTTRVLGILDTDASGSIDLKEFIVGVWNWCTYDVRLIAKFAFSIFDVDHTGVLSIYECDALLRMLFDTEECDEELLGLLKGSAGGKLSSTEFLDLAEANPRLVQPALDMQRQVRLQFFGVRYWEKHTRKRHKEFAVFDAIQNDARQSILDIVSMKVKQRQVRSRCDSLPREHAELQQLQDERKRIADALDEVEEKENEEESRIQRELLKMHTEAEIHVVEHDVSLDEEESRAWYVTTALPHRDDALQMLVARGLLMDLTMRIIFARGVNGRADLKALFEKLRKPHTYEQLSEKRELRNSLWKQYSCACERAQRNLMAKEKQRRARAEIDGRKRGKETLQSDTGSATVEFAVASAYCTAVGKRWQQGTPMQRLLAPLLIPETEWQVPLAARILVAVSNDPALRLLREAEEGKVLQVLGIGTNVSSAPL